MEQFLSISHNKNDTILTPNMQYTVIKLIIQLWAIISMISPTVVQVLKIVNLYTHYDTDSLFFFNN